MTDEHTPKPEAPEHESASASMDADAANGSQTPAVDAAEQPASASAEAAEAATAAEGQALGEDDLLEALRQVIDPELMINVVDLGLVYAINQDDRQVYVDMTLTSPACPAGPQIVQQAKMALERLEGVDAAEIKLVMSPPWSPERMTEDARDRLGIF